MTLPDPTSTVAEPARRFLRILVAEDDATSRFVIGKQVEHLGHEVVVVDDGLEAERALDEGGFDLLITDLHMPRLDGLALAQRIRAREADSGGVRIPIVALSASMAEDADSCLAHGMDAFVSKPIRPDELREVLDAVTNAGTEDEDGRPRGQEAMEAGDGQPRGQEAVEAGDGQPRGQEAVEAGDGQPRDQEAVEGGSPAPPAGTEPAAGPLHPDVGRNLPALDPSLLEEVYDGITEEALDTLDGFARSIAPTVEGLALALESGDLEQVARSAHAVAGAARMAGAIELGALCSDIEESADRGAVDGAEELLDEVHGALSRLERAIERLRTEHGS